MIKVLFAVFALLTMSSFVSCKKQEEELIQDNLANVMQTAMGEIGTSSTATEGANSPLVGCAFTNVRSSCSGAVRTITWNSCYIGTTAMSGGWTETFNSATACSNFTSSGGLASNGDAVTRTTSSSLATFLSGITLSTDSGGGVAWDGTVINSNGTTITQGAGASRTVNIDGIHRVLKGPMGVKWFDHFITGNLTVTGKRSSGNRTVSSGTVNVYHNLMKYTASNLFSGVTWGSSTCCYPTSGTITATLAGSVNGTVTLDFAPGATTCGNASYTNTSGTTSTIALTHCP
ncbi:MAG: hypothetical protein A4S09_10750 [Proteobacteria bacterium SG_bin7]|nr:MAG: hypothetical protein A4S09_10750 [Proteobacteria bacterium SG_bin7]